jgi:hypothetical protein
MHRIVLSFAALFLSLAAHPARSAEGMWTLDNMPQAQMQAAYGFAPDAAWIGKAMRAAVLLASGCSGSFISPDGLVMTNHHCAVGCVEQLSTPSKDLVRAGFLARTREQELQCPDIEVNRLERISDVTQAVQSATRGLDGAAFTKAQDAIRAQLTRECLGSETEAVRCDLVTLYQGGQYHLYRYHRFTDVRLVWVPEAAVADFGGDPDNFNFPRWGFDAALLRAYENGQPAQVSDWLRVQPAGAQPGELTFVVGHPGRTERLLTVAQLEERRRDLGERIVPSIAEARGMLLQYAKSGAEPARLAGNAITGVENFLKITRGQLLALNEPSLLARKRGDEHALQAFVASHPDFRDVLVAWDAIAHAEAVHRELIEEYDLLEEGRAFGGRYFRFARLLVRGTQERSKPDAERLPEFAEAVLPQRERALRSRAPTYPAYEQVLLSASLTRLRSVLGQDHPLVAQVLGSEAPDAVAQRLVAGTKLGDPAERLRLWQGRQQAIEQSDDTFIRLALALEPMSRLLRARYDGQVLGVERKNAERIARARFAMTGTSVYPDASFSLRLSYGEVRGWNEKGTVVPPFTDFAGAFVRHTGSEPFALPSSWLRAKDRLDGRQRLNFITDNDIIGGNSGSPILNRRLEFVGLIFDGNIHAIGGDFSFDAERNRAVGVHVGAITEALLKIYDASFLLDEMGVVH